MKIIRKCRYCGIEALTVDDLDLFKPHKHCSYGRQNKCKECHNTLHCKPYRDNNKQQCYTAVRKWTINNRDKRRAIDATRRATKINATPDWLTKEDKENIKSFYTEAKRLTELTGIIYEVDHIIPLSRGGLHEPYNLRVITLKQNRQKGNKLDNKLKDCNE